MSHMAPPQRARASYPSASESDSASRIAELERERDELKRDVEALCRQQAGYSGTIDVMARMQARKAITLEKDLADCQRKVLDAERKCNDTQTELSEAFRAKVQLTEQLRIEMQKVDDAQEEVKFFQSQAGSVLAERDKVLAEVETLSENCAALEEDNRELSERLQELESDLEEAIDVQESLKEQLQKTSDATNPREGKAEGLALPEEDSEPGRAMQGSGTTQLTEGEAGEDVDSRGNSGNSEVVDEEIEVSRGDEAGAEEWRERVRVADQRAELAERALGETVVELTQVLEEISSQAEAGNNLLHTFFADAHANAHALAETTRASVAQAREEVKDASKMLTQLLEMEGERLREEAEDRWRAVVGELRGQLEEERIERERRGDAALFGGAVSGRDDAGAREIGEDVLSQAMREKVQALLLLSQQEERHHLEMNTAVARLEEVDELKRNLSQVAREKVAALMEVAQLRKENESLTQQNRDLLGTLRSSCRGTSLGGGMIPASWSGALAEPGPEPPATSTSPNLGATVTSVSATWRRALMRGLSGVSGGDQTPRITAGPETAVSPRRRNTEEAASFAQLKVENVALQEHMGTVRRLTDSAHRMRLALAQVANRTTSPPPTSSENNNNNNNGSEGSVESAMAEVEAVAAEARQLKVALGGSLPVSWAPGMPLGQGSFGRGEESEGGQNFGERERHEDSEDTRMEGNVRGVLDTASAVGMEMAELLLATAELQKAILRKPFLALPP